MRTGFWQPTSLLSSALISAALTAPVVGQGPQGAQAVEPPPIKRAVAPPAGPYAPGFDALHYDVQLELPVSGKAIRGRTTVTVRLRAPRPTTLALDLTGLIVDRVRVRGSAVAFDYRDGRIRVPVPTAARVGDVIPIEVTYRGEPDDGLVIRTNVHGERTVFADNWPNRARFWFPSIDHPSDKATVAFTVSAPEGWTVLANGAPAPGAARGPLFAGGSARGERRRVWRWRADRPIPTYTMVIGAARLTRGSIARSCVARKCVDVTWWAFPADVDKMRPSFRRAGAMLEYFARLVAPFEYEKLAHVESSTEFQGMENTTVIFYSEEHISGGQDIEPTVVHETAHQWFGNSVTIRDWHELWLSEGFATYMAALFYQHADGETRFRSVMEAERQEYLHSDVVGRPVIDPTQQDLLALINGNNYQKGAWVLHMLRGMLGDRAFFDGVRAYYRRHRLGSASTQDLRAAFEAAGGRELGWFFQQWLYEPGYPKLRSSMEWNEGRREVTVTIEQVQEGTWPTYRLPLTIQLPGATPERHDVELTARTQTFRFQTPQAPMAVHLDPDGLVLKQIIH